jgi:hypothetical protein
MTAGSHDPSGIRIAGPVLKELGAMRGAGHRAVLIRSIGSISQGAGEPVDIPGAPPGTSYLALVPAEPSLPVIIYRPMLPDEDGDWLVTALLDRDTYRQQREAEKRGILGDPAIRSSIQVAAETASNVAIHGEIRVGHGAAKS